MKRGIWVSLFWFFLLVPGSRAVTTSILDAPATLGDDKFAVTVQVEGASAGTNYLRLDLYLAGTKNYFGETDNTQSWYGGSDGKQYYPVTIETNTPLLATVSGRLGEPSLTEYPGPGEYLLRVRRYTSSGSQGSEEVSPVTVQLTKTWPSPSPSPTPTLTPSTPPSPSPTPAPTPTPSPSPKPPTPSPAASLDPTPQPGTVAGESTLLDLSLYGVSPSPSTPSPSPQVTELAVNQDRLRFLLLTGTGLCLLSLAVYLAYRARRIQLTHDNP